MDYKYPNPIFIKMIGKARVESEFFSEIPRKIKLDLLFFRRGWVPHYLQIADVRYS